MERKSLSLLTGKRNQAGARARTILVLSGAAVPKRHELNAQDKRFCNFPLNLALVISLFLIHKLFRLAKKCMTYSKCMISKLKIGMEMVYPFTGKSDVSAWLKKIRLIAKLMDVEDLVSFKLLYLEGSALALYLEISKEAQQFAKKNRGQVKEGRGIYSRCLCQ